jgi:uncharacterized membrane protein
MYTIPVLHPLVVHFPVAYLTAAGGIGAVWLLSGRPVWRIVTAVLLGLGILGAIAALLTGDDMEEFAHGDRVVRELVDTHETMGMIATIVAGTALGLLLAAWLAGRLPRKASGQRDPLWVRLAVGALALAAAGLVLYTGHLGGTMVWGQPAP